MKKLIMLGLLLCASCTTVFVDGPKPIKCTDLTPKELQQDTPHAPAPQNSAENEWVNFGIAEAGQLNIANRDKRLSQELCQKIEAANDAAAKAAERRNKHWWQRIF
jgi:hypothetical protein